jgi:hypothetical protein
VAESESLPLLNTVCGNWERGPRDWVGFCAGAPTLGRVLGRGPLQPGKGAKIGIGVPWYWPVNWQIRG